MVNRKKSPVVDKEKKICSKTSIDDSSGDESKRLQSEMQCSASATSENIGQAIEGGSIDCPGPSGLSGRVVPMEVTANNPCKDAAACVSNQDPIAKGLPVVPHQIATRSVTGRLTKRLRSFSPPHSPPPTKKQAKDVPKLPVNNTTGTPEIKTRKQWEQWRVEDKDLFFEALNENGKDFEAIQNWIAQKLKKKDPNCGVRTKDHIRHFYYRTWHKIMKYIDVEGIDDINKQAVELYGLINYGELRKRIGKFGDKSGQKLNELVHRGVTVVKVKSKNNRIKTPVCRALKKLHHIEDQKEDEKSKMPERVTIELFPHTNIAWTQVQSIAQNPRLRVTLRLSKRVASLVEFLNKKWTSDRVKMKGKLDEVEGASKEIKVNVPEGCKVSPLLVKQAPTAPKLEFSFNSYVEYRKGNLAASPQSKKVSKGILNRLEEIHIQQPSVSSQNVGKGPSNLQDNQVSSTDEISAQADSTTVSSPEKPGAGDSYNACSVIIDKELPSVLFQNEIPDKPDVPDVISTDRLDDSAIPFHDTQTDTDPKDCVMSCKQSGSADGDAVDTKPAELQPLKGPSHEEKDAHEKFTKLEQGLLQSDCGNMTIAELYMMMGCPKKLCLEYEWVEKKTSEDIWELNKKLNNMLRRLVHLATTEFIDFKKVKPMIQLNQSPSTKCSCGAARKDGTPPSSKLSVGRSPRVCGSPSTTRLRVNNRRPSTPTSDGSSDPRTPGKPPRCVTPTTPTSSKCPTLIHSPDVSTKLPEGILIPAPSVGDDGVFKLPTALPPRVQQIRPNLLGTSDKVQILQQLNMVNNPDLFPPRRTGQRRLQRNVRRPLVVQRTLLPKAQTPARQIMTLTMVPGASAAGQTASFLPVISESFQSISMKSQVVASTSLQSQGTSTSVAPAHVVKGTTVTRATGGNVTTLSLSALGKPTTVRRIIPTPVTTAEESVLFCEAPEIAGSNNNLLKKAALAADITEHNTKASETGTVVPQQSLPSLSSLAQTGLASRPGVLSLTNPAATSQALNLTGVDPILSANPGISCDQTETTNAVGERMPLLSRGLGTDPPNISALLDISVPSVSDMGESTDKLIDLALMNSSSSFSGLGDKDASLSSLLNDRPTTPALSPTKGFKGISCLNPDEQWLNGEEFSISNFLRESPMKKPPTDHPLTPVPAPYSLIPRASTSQDMRALSQQLAAQSHQPFILSESSRDSVILGKLDVDTTLQAMMNENSMDYMAKFADLAAQISATANQDPNRGTRKPSEILEDKAS